MADPDEPRGELDVLPWIERLGEVPTPRRPWLPSALTLAAGVLCAVAAGVRLGAPGVVSGFAAALVVLAFFTSSALPLQAIEATSAPRGLGFVLILTNYLLRVVLALVLLALLVRSGQADSGALGTSVVACGLVRVNAQAVLLGRRQGNR